MGTRVQLPPGCSGITCEDGTRYSGKKGGFVEVQDHHANAINKQLGFGSRLLSAKFMVNIGTKKSRWCGPCGKLWQAWSHDCPRCGEPTSPFETDTSEETHDDLRNT